MYIGKRIQELRKAQGIKLAELAEKSGVQIATLSRMENEKMTGSLDSHLKIAKALGIEITALYSNIVADEKRIDVKAANAESDLFVHNEKASYEILTQKLMSKKMMPVLLKIEPGGQTNSEQNIAGSEKFIFVLDGKIEAKIGEEKVSLTKSSTLYFDASLPHLFINDGKSTAKILCVTTPVVL